MLVGVRYNFQLIKGETIMAENENNWRDELNEEIEELPDLTDEEVAVEYVTYSEKAFN